MVDKVNKTDSVINTIIHADVIDGLKKIDSDSVSLIFTSPPYNLDIPYGNHNDNMPWDIYLDWLKQIWTDCFRVLRRGGRLVINIDAITNKCDDVDKEYVRPIYAELVNMMREIGFKFKAEICWYKHQTSGSGIPWGSYCLCSSPHIRRNHEYVLVWCKDDYKLEGDSELSDMTPEEFELWTLSVWHIHPETRNLGNHPAKFPEELARRVIKLYSYRNDIILDPFMGSGTTAKVCIDNGRKYIGIDNNLGYVEYARSRVREAESTAAMEAELNPYVPRSERLRENKPKTVRQKSKSKNEIVFDS